MFRQKCLVVKNEKTAPGHFTLTLRSSRISKNAKPGQFVQIQCAADSCDPLLPRPFSFLTVGTSVFSILYQVVGKGTELLAHKKKGDEIWVVGPLGNGFSLSFRAKSRNLNERSLHSALSLGRDDKIALVGGGVGIPPLYHLAEELLKNKMNQKNIHVFLGARNKSLLLCEKEFNRLGINLHLATDDGTRGKKGFITELLDDFFSVSRLPYPVSQIFTCGPTPMLKAVSRLAAKYKVPCEVSVEEPMACGFGACLGCAIKVRNMGDGRRETGYKSVKKPYPVSRIPSPDSRFAIACCEGPVFKAEEIVW